MKLLFTDLDGTLLQDDKSIALCDKKAICTAIEKGHKFVITTGRPLVSAKRIAAKYGFLNPGFLLVSFNGGLIYDCSLAKPILTRHIAIDDVKFIMDAAHAHGLHAHTYAGDLVISEYETNQLKAYCESMNMEYEIVSDIREYFAGNVFGTPNVPLNVIVQPPIKVNVITPHDHEDLVKFRQIMRRTTEGKLFDVFSNPEMIEFSHLKSNKGDAVRFMADYYKVDISNTVAVGDEENDAPMIFAAGIGVAMANGSNAVKSIADYVTINDNNHGGVKEVIEKFILG